MIHLHKRIAGCLAVLLLFTVPVSALEEGNATEPSAEEGGLIVQDPTAFEQEEATDYAAYLLDHADKEKAAVSDGFRVQGTSFSRASEDAAEETIDGRACLVTEDDGFVEWELSVAKSGLYAVRLRYYPVEGNGSDIERSLKLDGESPFDEAESLTFPRVWINENPIVQDNRGNDIAPRQVEAPRWMDEPIRDSLGYYNEAFLFYLEKGSHVLRLEAVKEPMAIESLEFGAPDAVKSYAEMAEEYLKNGYTVIDKEFVLPIEAETPQRKSSPVLTPASDHSSPLTSPYDPAKQKLNILGGGRWTASGQWIEYDITVPQSGLYTFSMRLRQSEARGMLVSRRLYINGKLPFSEAGEMEYTYSGDWRNETLGTADEPYYLYLEAGKTYTFRLEASLGSKAEFCRIVSDSVSRLSGAYRRIIMITGVEPDIYRDYNISKVLPGVVELFQQEAERLQELNRRFVEAMGGRSSYSAILDTIVKQLTEMAAKPERIPGKLKAFNQNLSAMGTWILNVSAVPLDIDRLYLTGDRHTLPQAKASLWQKLSHEFRTFMASFFEDYNTIGDTADYDRTITVWINAGRDQANLLKQQINTDFTPNHRIGVNLQLVQGALLQATVSGVGPDVALTVGQGDAVNYGLRHAVLDLSSNPGLDEVLARFPEEAVVPLQFDGKLYGLPERITFPMLFYRTDVFRNIGADVPETWQDVYELLPVLHRYNMQMGLSAEGLGSYGMFLYQHGGTFYNEDGSRSQLDSEEAIAAMKQWSEFYTNYRLPVSFDFANRFRSGEMPIGISDYTTYNLLSVFAPEIRNQWAFAPIPGTMQEDGRIDRTAFMSVTPCMMMKDCRDVGAAWEFMTWWTSADVQLEFGRGLESLLGETGRYPTANLEAMAGLPWPSRDFSNLKIQLASARAMPEVPGGYFVSRHVDNAFRTVIYDNKDAREVLYDYALTINKEIDTKRKEFQLPLYQD